MLTINSRLKLDKIFIYFNIYIIFFTFDIKNGCMIH